MKKLSIFVVVALLALTLILCGCEPMPEEDLSLENWQSYLADTALVKNVVIGGSHDAGTSTMAWVARTQSATVKEQLKSGCRYFDLRVQKTDKGLFIFHSIVRGAEFEPILDDVADFISTHTTEFLILDFQHFKDDSQTDVSNLIDEKLSDYVVKNTTTKNDLDFVDSLTVNDVRGKCLVLWGSDTPDSTKSATLFRRNNDEGTLADCSLDSYYFSEYNKMNSADYIEKGLPYYISLFKEKNKGLFVLQGQLTDGILVRGPQSLEKKHDANMTAYVAALADSDDLQYINIIMRDFVNTAKMKNIVKLNLSKGTIATESLSTFEAIFN